VGRRYQRQPQGQQHLEPQPSQQSPGQAVKEEEDQEVEAVPAVEEPVERLSEGEHQSPLRSNQQPSTTYRSTMLPRLDSRNTNWPRRNSTMSLTENRRA